MPWPSASRSWKPAARVCSTTRRGDHEDLTGATADSAILPGGVGEPSVALELRGAALPLLPPAPLLPMAAREGTAERTCGERGLLHCGDGCRCHSSQAMGGLGAAGVAGDGDAAAGGRCCNVGCAP